MYFSKYYIITQLRDLIPKSSIKKYNEKSGGMVTVLIEIDDLTLYWKKLSVIKIDFDLQYSNGNLPEKEKVFNLFPNCNQTEKLRNIFLQKYNVIPQLFENLVFSL